MCYALYIPLYYSVPFLTPNKEHEITLCNFLVSKLFSYLNTNMSVTEAIIEAKKEYVETSSGEQDIYLEHTEDHASETCQSTFETKPNLTHHQQLEHKDLKPFICHICNAAHQHKIQLTKHIKRAHTKSKPYKCNTCPLTFGLSWNLKNHKSFVHDKYRPFECHHCPRQTRTKHELTNHIKAVHEKVKDFACEKCGKCFVNKASLRNHCLLMHGNLIANIPCSACGKLFRTKRYEKEHFQNVHYKIRKFKCCLCDKKFQSGSLCRRHMKVHIKHNNSGNDAAQLPHKKGTHNMSNSSLKSAVKQEKSTLTQDNHGEIEQNENNSRQDETQESSSNDTSDNLLNFESNMDMLGDVLNEFDMIDKYTI